VARNRRGSVDVEQRAQHEGAQMHARMRHREARHANAPPAVQQQVDVERARRVALDAVVAAPVLASLDRVECVEQRPRRRFVRTATTALT
jgi:hypothetical protein